MVRSDTTEEGNLRAYIGQFRKRKKFKIDFFLCLWNLTARGWQRSNHYIGCHVYLYMKWFHQLTPRLNNTGKIIFKVKSFRNLIIFSRYATVASTVKAGTAEGEGLVELQPHHVFVWV